MSKFETYDNRTVESFYLIQSENITPTPGAYRGDGSFTIHRMVLLCSDCLKVSMKAFDAMTQRETPKC